jgi:hypothetical protein
MQRFVFGFRRTDFASELEATEGGESNERRKVQETHVHIR